ncbi:hypothetical protein AAMO2058_000114700 [Amorphochlora amoebiformis]
MCARGGPMGPLLFIITFIGHFHPIEASARLRQGWTASTKGLQGRSYRPNRPTRQIQQVPRSLVTSRGEFSRQRVPDFSRDLKRDHAGRRFLSSPLIERLVARRKGVVGLALMAALGGFGGLPGGEMPAQAMFGWGGNAAKGVADEEDDDDDDEDSSSANATALEKTDTVIANETVVREKKDPFILNILFPHRLIKFGDAAVGLSLIALMYVGNKHWLSLVDYLRYGKPDGLAYPGIFDKDLAAAVRATQIWVLGAYVTGRMVDAVLAGQGTTVHGLFGFSSKMENPSGDSDQITKAIEPPVEKADNTDVDAEEIETTEAKVASAV